MCVFHVGRCLVQEGNPVLVLVRGRSGEIAHAARGRDNRLRDAMEWLFLEA